MSIPARWLPHHVEPLREGVFQAAPLLKLVDAIPLDSGLTVWDAWPVQLRDGAPWELPGGVQLWMGLAAPRFDDPDERHGHARIHLFLRDKDLWRDLGAAMPDGFSPGSREWSGSAIVDPADTTLTLYFTAAGRRGETAQSFEQRIFAAEATVTSVADRVRCTDWRNLREVMVRDPRYYMATDAGIGEIGKIKAFRDPGYFRDPVDGCEYLLFSGSATGSTSQFNGVVGMARAKGNEWQLLPPIISADGLNNELERPHIVAHGGLYYLFWSTQKHVFDPQGPCGPTGLYGMVSSKLTEGWEPLNGTGLVLSNPQQAPAQAYSWLVLPDLSVTSFIDQWGGEDNADASRRFGGTFAPFLQLKLSGTSACLAD